ncbi:hypothetical protein Syun_018590 [Stephania yunnanensis]|uniref:Tetratricopeptide repeat protein n=1 Tax=Stephania yunnanensis TaxID=152371 RepID=A0AAP0ISI3_9MAGN
MFQVKLNPSSIDAWLALGNCFTKKGELTSAKNCYNRGLEKGPNKCLLCDLSMVERMLAQGKKLTLPHYFVLLCLRGCGRS